MSKADNAVLALSRGMYGKRIAEHQYDELLSLKSTAEIAAYLKANTSYGEVLDKAAATEWTPSGLCEAVGRYFFACFDKICRFEIAVGQEIYKYFLRKNEIDQILECTVHILGGSKGAYLKSMSSFLDRHLSFDLFALARAESIEEISACLKKTPYKAIFDRCMLNEDATYLTYEKAFQAYLVNYQRKLIKKGFTGKAQREILDTVSRQYDVKLIETLTRVIRYYSSKQSVVKELSGNEITLFTDKQLNKLLSCKSLSELDEVLSKTPYKALSHLSESDDITGDAEKYLFEFYKKQLRFSQNPCVVMFSFLNLCKQEKNNLIKIIEGKNYDLPPQEIKNSLCI